MNKFTSIHYLVAMLKAYGIKNIVTSPGTQNAFFNVLVQDDSFFNCYSVIDERSASYVATGIARETNSPCIMTCTGATASRNYLSALTEAYYNKIPIIALTFENASSSSHKLSPQFNDKSITQNDIKALTIDLPRLQGAVDRSNFFTNLNTALITSITKKMPVHIKCSSSLDFKLVDEVKGLPTDIWRPEIYQEDFEFLKEDLKNKKIAVFIGSHHKFSDYENQVLSDFVERYNAVVYCDHTSGYKGSNKIIASQITLSKTEIEQPDILIDIGEISGDYHSIKMFYSPKIWRISPDKNPKFRNGFPVEKMFLCEETYFFKSLLPDEENSVNYYETISKIKGNLSEPELPLSTPFVAYHLSKNVPDNSSIHAAILNSFRMLNQFDLNKTIDVTCNTGGFGIDGALSTTVGQSFVNKDRKYFCLIGDLAFFYDMNILGNKHITNNLRILLVNNNRGEEFSIGCRAMHHHIAPHVAAEGHNLGGAKGWAESCGFEYLRARTKTELEKQINDFCTKEYDRPVLFEVFTTEENETLAFNLLAQREIIKDEENV